MSGPLVTADALAAALTGPTPPLVLDVRWALGDAHGHEHFRAGHVPGAVFVDLETELAGPASPERGRHPLPDVAVLQATARRWGLAAHQPVVVCDATGGLAAARAWWLLRWAGVAEVALLDGGVPAWERAGHPLEVGDGAAHPEGDVVLTAGHLPVLDADEAAALARDGVLLDARAGERYRGEAEPVDPRAGHVPGAVSAPTAENLAADATFLPAAELADRARGLAGGAGTLGVYCGSGVTASHAVLALAVAGVDAALYPGSWSQWSADADRPAATGPEPG